MGAAAFGFRPLWINRGRMPEEYGELPPLREVSNLAGLAALTL
jgi:2-haloacid dehalogenase